MYNRKSAVKSAVILPEKRNKKSFKSRWHDKSDSDMIIKHAAERSDLYYKVIQYALIFENWTDVQTQNVNLFFNYNNQIIILN